jgi:hypothetical protein
VEIYGESVRGLCNGIYDFLAALGMKWPSPEQEIPPAGPGNGAALFPLESPGAYYPSRFAGGENKGCVNAEAPWRRYVVNRKDPVLKSRKKREALAAWAARNKYDVLVFPLWFVRGRSGAALKLVNEYAMIAEAGGRELSVLVPRRFFFFHREVFRMEEGKRRKKTNFCPTNPDSIRIIKKEGRKIFRAAKGIVVFHLWPDGGVENAWCACPSCRAFTPAEQYRIAVNATADVLARANLGAVISFYEKNGEGNSIPLRPNLFRLEELPD